MDLEKLKSNIKNVFEKYGYLENEQDFKTHLAHVLIKHGYSVTAEHSYEISQNDYPEHADIVAWNPDGYVQDIIEVKYKINNQIDRRGNEVSNSNESSGDEFENDIRRVMTFVRRSGHHPSGFVVYITDNDIWCNDIINLENKYADSFSWKNYICTTELGESFYLLMGQY